jgi:peptide/nickel transport system permease protein
MIGLVTLTLMATGIIVIPMFSAFTYNGINVFQQFAPAGTISNDAGISTEAGHIYWLGSDDFGRDELTRLFFGGRITLSVALLGTLLVIVVGTLLGGIAGYFGGILDAIFVGLTDFASAFPVLPTLLILSRVLPVGGEYTNTQGEWMQTIDQAIHTIIGYSFVFVLVGWVPISRQVRASVRHTLTLDFIEAARALGAKSYRIIMKHLLPNAIGVILLTAVLTIGQFIIFESILSYMGKGVIQPVPTWGNMIRDAQDQMWFITNSLNPMEDIRGFLLILPGLMILISVVSINFIADALREALSAR